MKQRIEDLKKQMNVQRDSNGDWKTPYHELIKEVYNQEYLLVALSKSAYDPSEGFSKPLISTKDFNGTPAIYIFSDLDIANIWMQHYRHFSDDYRYGLIGAVRKSDYDFLSIFPIAWGLGARMIMLDEGGSYVGIDLNTFFEVTGIDMSRVAVPVSEEDLKKMLQQGGKATVNFVDIPALPLKAA